MFKRYSFIIHRITAALVLILVLIHTDSIFLQASAETVSLSVRSETAAVSQYEASFPESLSANSAILLEAETGRVIAAKNAHQKMPMASTTKIMTALVAIEQVPLDRVVKISERAVGIEGSSVYLFAGEELTMESLLYALLLASANDAAVAIALETAGSIEAFADLMNQKAKELGLTDTHFTNPHGLSDEEHYTTAYDLAIITAAAMKNETFRTMVSTYRKTIPHGGTAGVRLLLNHNKMLKYYDGAIGVKTGFTKQSGRCLVSAAERDGVRLIAVTLNAPNDWSDHKKMLDYGFSVYQSETLCQSGEYTFELSVMGGKTTTVTVSNRETIKVSLPESHPEIQTKIQLPRFLYGGIQEGDIIGSISFYCDTDGDGTAENIGDCALYANSSCELLRYPTRWESFWEAIKAFFQNLFCH